MKTPYKVLIVDICLHYIQYRLTSRTYKWKRRVIFTSSRKNVRKYFLDTHTHKTFKRNVLT